MADWFAWILAIGETTVSWLAAMELFGVSLVNIMIGFFLMGVLFRMLYRP